MESGRSAARPSASTLPTRAEISCSVGILEGNSLVDNAFAAPGVNGCGLVPLVFDPLVDISAGLPAAAGHNTAIMNGTVMITEARLVEQEAALPELGRCFKAPFTKVEGERRYHGSWLESACLNESRGGKFGEYEWSAGAGSLKKFKLANGATTLETAAGTNLTCAKATGTGEYTGAKTTSMSLKLIKCKLANSAETCQSAGAAAGEIVTGSLEGRLGFIEDQFNEGVATTVVGMDVTGQPSLLTAECGAQKKPLSVTGSAIGKLTPIDLMSKTFTLAFSQSGGHQAPESFEDDSATHALSMSVGAGGAESAGLSAAAKLTNEEKLEVKAEV